MSSITFVRHQSIRFERPKDFTRYEFFDRETQKGGLVEVRRITDNKGKQNLFVYLYRLDKGIKINVSHDR